MAALRDIARDFAAEIRDGIGWTIVYRIGRSWNALTIWSDIWNGEWETDDLNDAIGILKADPDAVIVNGYYCGHFGEDMTIDEIAAGIRWHYEGGHNRLADYCEVTQGRDALEEGRKAAEAAGLPFCERLADGGDFPVFEEQAAVFQVRPGHGLDICVADQQHRCSPFVRGAHLVSISSITARRASDKCFSFSFQPASC